MKGRVKLVPGTQHTTAGVPPLASVPLSSDCFVKDVLDFHERSVVFEYVAPTKSYTHNALDALKSSLSTVVFKGALFIPLQKWRKIPFLYLTKLKMLWQRRTKPRRRGYMRTVFLLLLLLLYVCLILSWMYSYDTYLCSDDVLCVDYPILILYSNIEHLIYKFREKKTFILIYFFFSICRCHT